MPLDNMSKDSKNITQDPEIPVPGRPRTTPRVNDSKANTAADMLNIPGRNTIRGAMEKRKKMLDEL
jgi:hypothetical protein